MTEISWLRAVDCSLLQPSADEVDPLAQRLIQRLMEIALFQRGSDALAKAMLEEVAAALRRSGGYLGASAGGHGALVAFAARRQAGCRDQVLADGSVGPRVRHVFGADRRPTGTGRRLPELYRKAQSCAAGIPAARSFFPCRTRICRGRGALLGPSSRAGTGLGRASRQGGTTRSARRHRPANEPERETIPLLEHIAAKAAHLLRCERASIFLWDKARKELVGRPALGLPNGELRLPEDTGIVGRVIQTGVAANRG